jgi:hypothetical protein
MSPVKLSGICMNFNLTDEMSKLLVPNAIIWVRTLISPFFACEFSNDLSFRLSNNKTVFKYVVKI